MMIEMFCAYLALLGGFSAGIRGQNLPPGVHQSSISGKQRLAAIEKIDAQLKKLSPHDSSAKRAEYLLSQEACICEPVLQDSPRESLFRIIRGAKVKRKHWFGVMPVYLVDAKVSRIIREFVEAKPPVYAGIDPDAPIIYLRVDGPPSAKAVKNFILGINTRAHQDE